MANVSDLTNQLIELNRQMAANPDKKVSTVTKRNQYGQIDEVTHQSFGMPELMDQADDLCDQLEAALPDATPAEAAKAGYAGIDYATIATRYADAELKAAHLPGKAALTNDRWATLAGMVVAFEGYGYRVN
jgi:hypothetical protein